MYIADYYLQRLKLAPTIITEYGPDFTDYTRNITFIPDQPQSVGTLQYRNIITASHRDWFADNIQFAQPPELNAQAIAALQTAELFVLAPLLPNYDTDYVRAMMAYLPETCVSVLCAQGYLRTVDDDSHVLPRDFAEAPDILPLFAVTVLSDEDHPEALKMAHEWKQLPGAGDIVLTHGPKGASIITKLSQQTIPTSAVEEADIVDSVGCGDVFVGALAHNYLQGRQLAGAVKAAHLAARNKLLAVNDSAVQASATTNFIS